MIHNWISAIPLILLPVAPSMQTPPLPQFTLTLPGKAYVGLEVKHKPYSAQYESEETHIWGSAEKVTHTSTSTRIYQDSEGRTRTEQPVFELAGEERQKPSIIEILDPVAGCQYTLDTENHIAHRVKATPFPQQSIGEPAPERLALLRSVILFPSPPPPPPPPPQPHSNAGPSPEHTQESASITFEPRGSGNTTEESLGTQRIEGVLAEGHRNTTRMARVKGESGAAAYVYETWFAPEIQEFVMMKTSDPRTGESIQRLTHIVLGDPDSALFRIPDNYRIVDESGPFQIVYKR
jgi:hypothetical protein